MAGQRWLGPVPEPDLTGGPIESPMIDVERSWDEVAEIIKRAYSIPPPVTARDLFGDGDPREFGGTMPDGRRWVHPPYGPTRVERPSVLFVPNDANIVPPPGYRGEADCARCRCFGEYCGHIEEGV